VRRTGPTGARRATALLAVVATVVLALDIATKVLVVAELEGRRTLELLGGPAARPVQPQPRARRSPSPRARRCCSPRSP
jgi:hypothetical protein